MYYRDRVKVNVARAYITATGITPVIPAVSGYSYNIVQISAHEEQGLVRDIRMFFGNEPYFNMTIGASGTIVWDYQLGQDMPIGSGFNASLDYPGNVLLMTRYVVEDQRTPTNLNGATYVPRAIRTPNQFGSQAQS